MGLLASNLDSLTIAAFLAAVFINKQALIVLAAHLVGEAIYRTPLAGFETELLLAALYSSCAIVNIRIKSEIRQALICIGIVYWFGAVDYMLTDSVSVYDYFLPAMITALDLFILWHLAGGLKNGVSSPIGNCWSTRL